MNARIAVGAVYRMFTPQRAMMSHSRSGPGWFLVGDAAGFLDPFTGEGIHRALISAELAADAILASRARGASDIAERYDRAMRRRFLGKDRVSGLVQAFLGHPALFEYAARRIASREPVRETVGTQVRSNGRLGGYFDELEAANP